MIRQLWLTNENNRIYKLSNNTKTVVTNLSGLGVSLQNSYIENNNDYLKTRSKTPLSTIELTIVFLNGYKGFIDFTEYLFGNNQLKLYVKTPVSTRYCYVEVSNLPKSELISNSLFSNIKFEKTSLWLEDYEHQIELNTDDVGKVFPHTFPFTFSESYQGTVQLTNKGCHPAPTIIEINGAVKDPIIYVYKDNGLIASLRVFIDSDNDYHKISIDSRINKQQVIKYENQISTNIYELLDFERENFISLPVGVSTVVFDPGKMSSATCKIKFVESYLSS